MPDLALHGLPNLSVPAPCVALRPPWRPSRAPSPPLTEPFVGGARTACAAEVCRTSAAERFISGLPTAPDPQPKRNDSRCISAPLGILPALQTACLPRSVNDYH